MVPPDAVLKGLVSSKFAYALHRISSFLSSDICFGFWLLQISLQVTLQVFTSCTFVPSSMLFFAVYSSIMALVLVMLGMYMNSDLDFVFSPPTCMIRPNLFICSSTILTPLTISSYVAKHSVPSSTYRSRISCSAEWIGRRNLLLLVNLFLVIFPFLLS